MNDTTTVRTSALLLLSAFVIAVSMLIGVVIGGDIAVEGIKHQCEERGEFIDRGEVDDVFTCRPLITTLPALPATED